MKTPLTWDNFREQRRIFGRPFVVAHRGAQTLQPENTLAAFILALVQGADALETDLRFTADDELVLFHDATVMQGPVFFVAGALFGRHVQVVGDHGT